jgi:flavin reductase (DIM6/NTAB) family NADH-FMN oxidoreductase RutF
MSDWFVEAANHTSGDFPPGADEAAAAGLTRLPSARVAPPRIAEAGVALECVLREVHNVAGGDGKPSSAVVIGQVVLAHVHPAVAGASPSGRLVVDATKLRPVARMGGNTYAASPALFDLPRPTDLGAAHGAG